MAALSRARRRDDPLAIRWPILAPGPGKHFWDAQLLSGLRGIGACITFGEVEQPVGDRLLVAELLTADGPHVIAIDTYDRPDVVNEVAERALVYFKLQFSQDGYAHESVVPGGYVLANNFSYRLLPLARALRSLRSFRHDVYGNFGLLYGGEAIRRRAFEILSGRRDLRYDGFLYRYPGGPSKVPYKRYLFEIARAKVCVDMPGGGDFCTRLVDYLAVGSCVVGPPPRVRLPFTLVDGVHIVYCRSDLSDLADVCAELVCDEAERERIARNARGFFDRFLHRRALAAYYAREIEDALAVSRGVSRPAEARRRQPGSAALSLDRTRRRRHSLASTVLAGIAAAIAIVVAAPEALGDHPYDPQPTRVVSAIRKAIITNSSNPAPPQPLGARRLA